MKLTLSITWVNAAFDHVSVGCLELLYNRSVLASDDLYCASISWVLLVVVNKMFFVVSSDKTVYWKYH